jgi:hypothetical protein
MKSLNEIIKESEIRNSQSYLLPKSYTFDEFLDINNIDESEITDEQVNFFYRYNNSQLLGRNIYENLKSYDTVFLIDKLKREIGSKKGIISIEYVVTNKSLTGLVRIDIDGKVYKNQSDLFELDNKIYKILDFYGYYTTDIEKNDYGDWELYIEAKNGVNVYDSLKRYKYVYHVTEKQNKSRIQKRGLVPKHGNYRYFPNRVYLIGGGKVKDHIIQATQDKGFEDGQYVICKIDIRKLHINIYIDEASKDKQHYFTYECIPPQCIEFLDNIDQVER